MHTNRISSLSYNSLLDFSALRFYSNLKTTPTIIDFDYLGDKYYFMSSPYILISIENQQTQKIKNLFAYQQTNGSGLAAGINVITASSYLFTRLYYTTRGTEDLANSIIKFGTPDYPLGYNILRFYEMEDMTSTDPADAIQKLQEGYLYTYPDNEGSDNYLEVDYKEYNNNDSDLDNIYQTNTYITP